MLSKQYSHLFPFFRQANGSKSIGPFHVRALAASILQSPCRPPFATLRPALLVGAKCSTVPSAKTRWRATQVNGPPPSFCASSSKPTCSLRTTRFSARSAGEMTSSFTAAVTREGERTNEVSILSFRGWRHRLTLGRTKLANGQVEPASGRTEAWEAALKPAEVTARANNGQYRVRRGFEEIEWQHITRDDRVIKGVEAERRARKIVVDQGNRSERNLTVARRTS